MKKNRIAAWVLCFALVISIIPITGVRAAGPVSLAEWKVTGFSSGELSVAATSGQSAAGATISIMNTIANGTATPGTIPNALAYTSSSINRPGGFLFSDVGGVSSYWLLSGIDATGYENIALRFSARSSGTGPRDFKIQYKINAVPDADTDAEAYAAANPNLNVWMNISAASYDYQVLSTTNVVMGTFSLPSDADNAADLSIRLVVASRLSSRAGTGKEDAADAFANGGTSGLQNVTVTGEPAYSDIKTARPTANPKTGERVADGTMIELECKTSGAAIYYTTDGSAPDTDSNEYTEPFALDFGTDASITVSAIAVKDGLDDSAVATFIYINQDLVSIAETSTLPPTAGDIDYGVKTYGNAIIAEWVLSEGEDQILATGGEQADIAELTASVRGRRPTMETSNSAPSVTGMMQGDFWMIQVSSTGIANITVASSQRSSGTGPRDFELQYSTDGANWLDAPGTVTVKSDKLNKTLPVTLPADANNQNELYIRWVVSTNYSVNTTEANTATIAAGGTTQINSITVSGGYIIDENQMHMPTANPAGGAVNIGQTIAFTGLEDEMALPGYMIMISGDNGLTYSQAGSGNTFEVPPEAVFPYTVLAYATADDPALPSRINTLTYTQTKAPLPVASPPAGSYQTMPAVTLSIPGAFAGSEIWYTTNGSTPARGGNGVKFEGAPITGLSLPVTIIAVAYAEGYADSDLMSAQYMLPNLDGQAPYFGQLHSHTKEYSDGKGKLIDAIKHVSEIPVSKNIDFVAITDHSHYWDIGDPNPPEALNDKDLMTPASLAKWEKYKKTIAEFDAGTLVDDTTKKAIPNPNGRVMIGGFEMTWNNGPGHINTFNSSGIISRNNSALNRKASDSGMRLYYDTLISDPDPLANLSQFNHPGSDFGNFKDFAYYSPSRDQKMVAVEVGHSKIMNGGYFSQYTLALDKGWHLAPTNNQDNHDETWGDKNDGRTVIYADSLSEKDLLQGLKNLSVYATEDKNLVIDYTINGERMGHIFDDTPDTLNFHISAYDPDVNDSISYFEIKTNSGRSLKIEEFPENNEWDYTLSGSDVKPGYYFVLVKQADGDFAVTAPIWIGESIPVGINSFEASSATAVVGEDTELTVTLFNSGDVNGTVNSIQWIVDGSIVHIESPYSVIDSAAMPTFGYAYTPTAPGPVYVTVKVTIIVNGVPKETVANMTLDVKGSSKISYIGIDGSHYNEYVNGHYKDQMTNFENLAMRYGVRVEILKTESDLIAASQNPQYKMLILTAPTRRLALTNMEGGFPGYSQSAIDAVANFSAQGNTVIITGWSNIYENTPVSAQDVPADTRHMAEEQNQLLAAIGATLRVSDDSMYMPYEAAGKYMQSQRFYLEDFDIGNPLFDGVFTKTDQPFSAYGSSSVYAVASPGSASPVSSLAFNIEGLVFNDATAVSADFDLGYGNSDGSSVPQTKNPAPPKYTSPSGNNSYLNTAVETVTHGGGMTSLVVVSGGAFMSNFEIQAEADAHTYSNYGLAENLVKSVAPTADVTPIIRTKLLVEGTEVTIEGVATSNSMSPDDPSNTKFTDDIYIQDSTGGVNAFSIATGVALGQTVRIKGTIGSYMGEVQVFTSSCEVVDSAITPVTPKVMTTHGAMSPGNDGLLIETSGTVTVVLYDSSGKITQFSITDGSGIEALVRIDDNITPDEYLGFVQPGAKVSVIGLATTGEDSPGDPQPYIRVRDRREITLAVTQNSSVNSSDPAGPVTIAPIPTPLGVVGYDDVSGGDWYYDAVTFVTVNEYISGASNSKFAPDGSITRNLLATILWQMAGRPEASISTSFRDVGRKHNSNAILWSVENGLLMDYGNRRFGPDDSIAREQLVVILFRFAKICGYDVTDVTSLEGFSDSDTISVYAVQATQWCAENGILMGYTDGSIVPRGDATRAEAAMFIMRFSEFISTHDRA